MLRIGEFSKLSMLTVKALRFYEREGLLLPSRVDSFSGYRFYEASQLETAGRIKALRQLGFSIEEIRLHLSGQPIGEALSRKRDELILRRDETLRQLSVINYLLEEQNMSYQVIIKDIPECIVYSEERRLERYSDMGTLVLESAEECLRLNPGIECVRPDYSFCEYLDGEYRERDVRLRYSQAVTKAGKENERIKFRRLPATRALCIYHKGSYERLGEAYAYIYRYAAENGYTAAGLHRECYLDGVWNKDSEEDYLTEIQLPVT